MQVWTTKGPVDLADLIATDTVTYDGSARVVATEWHMNGEMVRRDVHVSVLMPQSMGAEQGAIGG